MFCYILVIEPYLESIINSYHEFVWTDEDLFNIEECDITHLGLVAH